MPCNAVATVRARVAQDTLLAELAPVVVEATVRAYLERAYPTVCITPLSAPAGGCAFRVGALLTVRIQGAEVTLSSDPAAVRTYRELPAALTELLARAGGVLLQKRVRAALAARHSLASEQSTAGGALVLHIDL
jgi:hypothetical protein